MVSEVKKHLILRAKEHNWGLIGPGSWSTVSWSIYSDGSYSIRSEFLPDRGAFIDGYPDHLPKNDIKTTHGAMDTASFQKLIDLMSKELWRDPDIECHACDGVAWVIKQFDANGKVLKSSGDLDYIYGQRTLEEIARCLPSDDQIYDAPAFVAVSQKNGTNNFV